MKKVIFSCVLFALCGLLARSAVANVTYAFSGNKCVSDDGSGTAFRWDEDGIAILTDSASFRCPVGPRASNSVDVDETIIRYSDGDSDGSIGCALKLTTQSGTVYSSAKKWTCSTPGGCAQIELTYVGYNSLALGNDLASLDNVWNYAISCTTFYANQSRVLGYSVTQVSP